MSTVLLTQITRTGTYPAQIPLDVTYNRGFISFVTNNWTAQMFYELPAIKLDLYTDVEGTMVRSPLFSRTIKTYNPTFPLDQQCSICISMKDVPANCYLFVTPIFDNNAIEARNELIRNGIETGTLWTTKTNTFSILLSYEDNDSVPTNTITQQPPISFTSDGTSLFSWSMSGNGQQQDTPTPDAPIMPTFCGVRSAQLIDIGAWLASKGITYTKDGGEYTFNSSSSLHNEPLYFSSDDVVVSLSGLIENITASTGRIRLIKNDGTNATQSGIGDQFTKQENVLASGIKITVSTGGTLKVKNLMLNSGTTALPYEPYGWSEKITCAGQTSTVYLGQTQTVRRIRKLVLTGEEGTWRKSSTYQGSFYNQLLDMTGSGIPILCSHAVYAPRITATTYIYGKCAVDGGASVKNLNLFIGESSWSVSDFQQYLAAQYAAGTPVTVWYVLAEPETAIVNEPLAKIGDYADELSSTDAGVSIPTTKGANTLTVDGTLQPSSMTITGNIK